MHTREAAHFILTERTERLDAILAALDGRVSKPFVLHGWTAIHDMRNAAIRKPLCTMAEAVSAYMSKNETG